MPFCWLCRQPKKARHVDLKWAFENTFLNNMDESTHKIWYRKRYLLIFMVFITWCFIIGDLYIKCLYTVWLTSSWWGLKKSVVGLLSQKFWMIQRYKWCEFTCIERLVGDLRCNWGVFKGFTVVNSYKRPCFPWKSAL